MRTIRIAPILAVLVLAGCAGPSPISPVPARPTSASPSPSYRPGRVGVAFTIPGWRVTVNDQRCGSTADLTGDPLTVSSDQVCVVPLVGVNIASVPARFGQRDLSEPDGFPAIAFDVAGQQYAGQMWQTPLINPGTAETGQQLMVGVPAGVHLASVAIGDVLVGLTP